MKIPEFSPSLPAARKLQKELAASPDFGPQRFNPVKVRPGPQEECLAGHCRRGHEPIRERVRRQDLQVRPGLSTVVVPA